MERMFRLLRADEIELRVGSIAKNQQSFTLLLYKDARVDYRILDETIGCKNWRNHYSRDNANCTIEIWDAEKNQWIAKENVGEESNVSKEKGIASDSFKRAAFTLGIGRELYTAPTIRIYVSTLSPYQQSNLSYCAKDFEVTEIAYDDMDRIKTLKIKNNSTGNIIYAYPERKTAQKKKEEEQIKKEIELVPDTITENMWRSLKVLCKEKGEEVETICEKYGLDPKKPSDMKIAQYRKEMERLKNA